MKQQQGAILLITVIILLILLVASLALFRTTQSSTEVAGNIAFKQAALPVANIAIEQAIAELNSKTNFDATVTNRYYATQLSNNTDGLPANINWSQVSATPARFYSVQYIIERLCSTSPVTDINTQCVVGRSVSNNSYKVNSAVYVNGSIYYRVTVRVTGPKNTLTFVQTIIEH